MEINEVKTEKEYFKKYEVKYSKDELKDGINKIYLEVKKDVFIPGFRKGKAPIQIIEKYYGKDIFVNDAANDMIKDANEKIQNDNKIEPAVSPKVDDLKADKEEGVSFTIEYTTMPEGKVENYEGIEICTHDIEPTQEDIEKELEKIQKQNSRVIPVLDRKTQNGDIVNIDFEGYIDGEQFEGGSAKEYDLTLGSGTFIPGFEDQLIGLDIDEKKDVVVTFPEDYMQKEFAGKEATFKVTINDISEEVVPELDDEFAKDVSEYDTLSELKESIKKDLEEKNKSDLEDHQTHEIEDYLIEHVETELPDNIIDESLERDIDRFKSDFKNQGIELEKYLQYIQMPMETFKEQRRESVIKGLKSQIAIDYIIKNEKIEASQKEIDEEIENMAQAYGTSAAELKENDYVIEMVTENVKVKNAIKLLKEKAKKVEHHEDEKEEVKQEKKAKKQTKTKKDKEEAKRENKDEK